MDSSFAFSLLFLLFVLMRISLLENLNITTQLLSKQIVELKLVQFAAILFVSPPSPSKYAAIDAFIHMGKRPQTSNLVMILQMIASTFFVGVLEAI